MQLKNEPGSDNQAPSTACTSECAGLACTRAINNAYMLVFKDTMGCFVADVSALVA